MIMCHATTDNFDIGLSNISCMKVVRGDFMLYSSSFHVTKKF